MAEIEPTQFSGFPYYDDYLDEKKFLKMLFKPGYALQARELTQAQTILQKQISRFANHIFKDGSPVVDGQLGVVSTNFIRIDTTVTGPSDDIVVNPLQCTKIQDEGDSCRICNRKRPIPCSVC